MERMIQALFSTETEAFKGLLAIQQLNAVNPMFCLRMRTALPPSALRRMKLKGTAQLAVVL
jgi:hypothetical protein